MKRNKVCQTCGLPTDLCVCLELEKGEVECDDFEYCELCGQAHYKNHHIKSKLSLKGLK